MSDEYAAPGESEISEFHAIEILTSQYDSLTDPEQIRMKAKEIAEEVVLNSDNELIILTTLSMALGDITKSKTVGGLEVERAPARQTRGAALLDALEAQIESAKLLYKRALPASFLDADTEEIVRWKDTTEQTYNSVTRAAIGVHRKHISPNQKYFRKVAFDRIRNKRSAQTGKVETDDEIRTFLNRYSANANQEGSLAMMQYAYPGVMELLRNVKVSIEQNTEPEDFLMHMRPLLYNRFDLWEQNKGLSEKELFELHRSIYTIALNHTAPGLELKKPKILLWQANRQENTLAKQLPSILKEAKGESGVTLESLLDKAIGVETAGWRLLDYIGNMPKGDLFMQEFTKEVLFFQPNSDASIDGNTFFGDRGQTQRIMELQLWLANKLIAPALNSDLRDENFDNKFARMITHLSPISVNNLGKMLHRSIIAAPSTRAMFDKDKSGISLVDDLPLADFVDRATLDDTTPRATEMAFIKLINQHADDISQSLRTRFFADYDKKMKPLENAFMLFVMPPIQPREDVVDVITEPEVETNPVAEFLQSRMNTQLFEQLKIDQAELKEVQDDVWRKAKEGRKMNYWLHPEGSYRIEFEQKTAMRIAGLKELQVTADPINSDEYHVKIILDTDLPPVLGVVSGEGRLTLADITIPPVLMTMIEHISVLSVQSLVCRTKADVTLITSEEITKPTVETSSIHGTTQRTEQVLKRLHDASTGRDTQGSSRTQLPTEMNSSSGSKRTRNVESDDKRESHFVAGSIHGTPYSVRFVQLLESYNRLEASHPGSADTFRNAIAFHYRRMHKINDERWKNLPEHLRDQIVTVEYPFDDPLNKIKKGQPVPVQNWYSAHYSPALDGDKVVKPKKMYRLYAENFYGPLAYFHDWYMRATLAGTIEETTQDDTA